MSALRNCPCTSDKIAVAKASICHTNTRPKFYTKGKCQGEAVTRPAVVGRWEGTPRVRTQATIVSRPGTRTPISTETYKTALTNRAVRSSLPRHPQNHHRALECEPRRTSSEVRTFAQKESTTVTFFHALDRNSKHDVRRCRFRHS